MSDTLATPIIDLNTPAVEFFGKKEYDFLRKFYKKNLVPKFERLPYWWEPETPGSRGLSDMSSWLHKETVLTFSKIIRLIIYDS